MGGLLGELFAINRRLLEEVQYSQRRERAEQAMSLHGLGADDEIAQG
jgi:hypothetical protein